MPTRVCGINWSTPVCVLTVKPDALQVDMTACTVQVLWNIFLIKEKASSSVAT